MSSLSKKLKKAVKKVAKIPKSTLKTVSKVAKTELGKTALTGSATFFGGPAAGAAVSKIDTINSKLKTAKKIKSQVDDVKKIIKKPKPVKPVSSPVVKDSVIDYAVEKKTPILLIAGVLAAVLVGYKLIKK